MTIYHPPSNTASPEVKLNLGTDYDETPYGPPSGCQWVDSGNSFITGGSFQGDPLLVRNKVSNSYDLSAHDSNEQALFTGHTNESFVRSFDFNSDGSKCFALNDGKIYSYDLNSQYDITDKSLGSSGSLDPNTTQWSFSFIDAGKKLVVAEEPNIIKIYDLPNSWSLNFPSNASSETTVPGTWSRINEVRVVDNGRKIYAAMIEEDTSNFAGAYMYDLSIPYDLDSAHNETIWQPNGQDVSGIDFDDKGEKAYVTTADNGNVYSDSMLGLQYNIPSSDQLITTVGGTDFSKESEPFLTVYEDIDGNNSGNAGTTAAGEPYDHSDTWAMSDGKTSYQLSGFNQDVGDELWAEIEFRGPITAESYVEQPIEIKASSGTGGGGDVSAEAVLVSYNYQAVNSQISLGNVNVDTTAAPSITLSTAGSPSIEFGDGTTSNTSPALDYDFSINDPQIDLGEAKAPVDNQIIELSTVSGARLFYAEGEIARVGNKLDYNYLAKDSLIDLGDSVNKVNKNNIDLSIAADPRPVIGGSGVIAKIDEVLKYDYFKKTPSINLGEAKASPEKPIIEFIPDDEAKTILGGSGVIASVDDEFIYNYSPKDVELELGAESDKEDGDGGGTGAFTNIVSPLDLKFNILDAKNTIGDHINEVPIKYNYSVNDIQNISVTEAVASPDRSLIFDISQVEFPVTVEVGGDTQTGEIQDGLIIDFSANDVQASSDVPEGGFNFYFAGNENDNIFQYSFSKTFDLSSPVQTIQSIDVSSEISTPKSIRWGYNGDKFYVASADNLDIYEYDASDKFDVTTGTYNGNSHDVSSEISSNLEDMYWRPDGKKFYLSESNSAKIYAYELSTAWDINTAFYDSEVLDVGTEDGSPTGITFSVDGKKLYVAGDSNTNIYEYDLGTSWYLTAANYNGNFHDVSSEDSDLEGIDVNNDGSKLYLAGKTNTNFYQYDLSTDWDITSATYNSVNIDASAKDSSPESITWGKSDSTLSDGTYGGKVVDATKTSIDFQNDNTSINLSGISPTVDLAKYELLNFDTTFSTGGSSIEAKTNLSSFDLVANNIEIDFSGSSITTEVDVLDYNYSVGDITNFVKDGKFVKPQPDEIKLSGLDPSIEISGEIVSEVDLAEFNLAIYSVGSLYGDGDLVTTTENIFEIIANDISFDGTIGEIKTSVDKALKYNIDNIGYAKPFVGDGLLVTPPSQEFEISNLDVFYEGGELIGSVDPINFNISLSGDARPLVGQAGSQIITSPSPTTINFAAIGSGAPDDSQDDGSGGSVEPATLKFDITGEPKPLIDKELIASTDTATIDFSPPDYTDPGEVVNDLNSASIRFDVEGEPKPLQVGPPIASTSDLKIKFSQREAGYDLDITPIVESDTKAKVGEPAVFNTILSGVKSYNLGGGEKLTNIPSLNIKFNEFDIFPDLGQFAKIETSQSHLGFGTGPRLGVEPADRRERDELTLQEKKEALSPDAVEIVKNGNTVYIAEERVKDVDMLEFLLDDIDNTTLTVEENRNFRIKANRDLRMDLIEGSTLRRVRKFRKSGFNREEFSDEVVEQDLDLGG